MPHQGLEEEIPGTKYQVKISQITMAYQNSYIVNELTKRGTFIKNEKWEEVKKINQEILCKIKDP